MSATSERRDPDSADSGAGDAGAGLGFGPGNYPPLARAAERVAARGQRWYLRSTLVELGIPLLAAIVSTVGVWSGVADRADPG